LYLSITDGLNIYFTQSSKKAETDQRFGGDVFIEEIVGNNLKIQWNHATSFIEGH